MAKTKQKRSKNSNKQKKANVRAVVPRMRPARMDPFLGCFLSSVASGPMEFDGIPDMYSGKTIVVEHIASYTITPNNAGKIAFAILPSALGGFALLRGVITGQALYDSNSGWSFNSTINTDDATWTTQYQTLPFAEYVNGQADPRQAAGSSQNAATFTSTEWRCAASKARITYSGNDYFNSGMIYTGRQVIKDLDTTFQSSGAIRSYVGTRDYFQISDGGPQTLASLSRAPDFAMARLGQIGAIEVSNVHTGDFTMKPFRDGFIPTDKGGSQEPTTVGEFPFAQLGYTTTGPSYEVYPMPGFSDMTTTFVMIEGMDTTNKQTINVTVRNCVEYAVAVGSTVSRFAKTSPKVNQGSLSSVVDAGKNMPSMIPAAEADQCGWTCKAKKVAGFAASAADVAAGFVPYLGQGWKMGKSLYGAFSNMGGGNALGGAFRYAIGY